MKKHVWGPADMAGYCQCKDCGSWLPKEYTNLFQMCFPSKEELCDLCGRDKSDGHTHGEAA